MLGFCLHFYTLKSHLLFVDSVMSVVQQLQMQEMNFSLKMEDKYLRQLGGFVDLLHFCIQSLGSMYIIEVLLLPLAVVLLF